MQSVHTTQVNSTFRARWLASSEVISQVLFTPEQPNKNEMAFVGMLSQIKACLSVCLCTFSFRLTRLKIAVPNKAESLLTRLSQLTATLNLPLKSYNSPGTNEKAIEMFLGVYSESQ